MEPFRVELNKYLANPILVVRRLAAQAILSTLDSQIKVSSYLHDILLSELYQTGSANRSHGLLLLIKSLLQSYADTSNE